MNKIVKMLLAIPIASVFVIVGTTGLILELTAGG